MKLKITALTLALLALAACGPGGGGGGGGVTGCNLSGTIDTQVTLTPSACSPYHVTGDLYVEEPGKLVIQPGTTLEFAQDTGLYVSGHGALVAVGTASDKILFTGASKTRGYWNGVVFQSFANSFDNELKYVEIEYAGADERWDGGAFGNYRAAVELEEEARTKMTYTVVRESEGFGVFMAYDAYFGADSSPDGDFAHNTLTQNAAGPIAIYENKVGHLDASNDFGGNDAGHDYVYVGAGYTAVPTQTWQRLNVPYLVHGYATVGDGELLTIAPGTTLVFQQDGGLEADGPSGAIHAVGTASEPIVFTALQPVKGYWYGLVFDDTRSTNNVLHYVTVEYGGADTDPELSANIVVTSSGNASSQWIEVKNSTIQHSAGHGISVAQETTYNSDIGTSNTFADIDGENFHVQP
ncbi:hypothetical protein [Oceanithermus desulfurans]|uniref:Lipoprotein n=2 Tax=Oceanithermus desulfurans TaxID=227924 RepID=A0A511RNT9_9DEIN|nr:hypothetical protein [Oceanithermus desulfurans]MBB6030958.1 hypothetical protein [Oceanithermus desulfurans]GEM90747.1 hypothetical protein ODE01S_21810 [Oceanithermus desulfurans NBRC 100063]